MSRQEAQPLICPKMQRLNAIQYFFQSFAADKIAHSVGDVVADIEVDAVVLRSVDLTRLWSLFGFNSGLLTHSSENDNI
jgi:hypothetical protein